VCLVVLSAMITGAAVSFLDEFWQLYLDRLNIPVIYFGLVSAALMFLRIPGNVIAHQLRRRFGYRTLLMGVTFFSAVGFLYLSMTTYISGLVIMMLVCLASGILEPLTAGYLHHRIDSSMRATIDSFQSLGLHLVHIVAGLGFGYYSSKFDIFGGFGFIAFICFAFWVYFMMASKNVVE